MATKKAAGSTALGRDSKAKRLGVKLYDGEVAQPGSIIVRQRGTKIHPGKNVMKGGDDTLFARIGGQIKFSAKKVKSFTGKLVTRKFVDIIVK